MDKNLDPVIVFDFSKRNCEALSEQMSSLDLTTDEEKALIDGVFNNAIDVLCDDDKRLPQVQIYLGFSRGESCPHATLRRTERNEGRMTAPPDFWPVAKAQAWDRDASFRTSAHHEGGD